MHLHTEEYISKLSVTIEYTFKLKISEGGVDLIILIGKGMNKKA